MDWKQDYLRALPAVDRLLQSEALMALAGEIPDCSRAQAVRQAVEEARQVILAATTEAELATDVALEALIRRAVALARESARPSLIPVINATGTLLHTNLGRAPLAPAALRAVQKVACGYANLEFDQSTGGRGQRSAHIEALLCELTGAEAALAVNNNAGAVMLALAALAGGREALVSRGELIEIGGSFRIPDVMQAAGARLREVGTTNKTHLRDYRDAISDATGLMLKVHTSNYRILGFTAAVSTADLVALGRKTGIPVLEDLGSGMLLDLTRFGLPREPTVAETVATGADVVTFSGDKLLGGPQAGLLVGKKAALDQIRTHPMARALRIDKLTLAALEATLRLYRDPEEAVAQIPLLSQLATSPEVLEVRCRRLQEWIGDQCGSQVTAEVRQSHGQVGGGALPLLELPGPVVTLQPTAIRPDDLALRLRQNQPPIVGRIHEDRLLLDLRTVPPEADDVVMQGLCRALGKPRS